MTGFATETAMPTALIHARVLTPQGWRDDVAVLLDAGRIVDLPPPADPRQGRFPLHP